MYVCELMDGYDGWGWMCVWGGVGPPRRGAAPLPGLSPGRRSPTSPPAAAAPAAAVPSPPRGTPAAGAMTRADPLPEAVEVGAAPCIC